jgi:hypothetical protein
VRHHHHAIAEALHLLHDVRREHDALARFVAQRAQDVAQRPGGHHVQPVGGFVEHDVGRVVHQRACERRLHPLALAEAVGAAVEQRLHVEQAAERLAARLDEVVGQPVQSPVVDDVLARREPRVQPARVRQHAQPRARALRVARGRQPVDLEAPGVRRDEADEHPQARRLAGAVRPQQPRDGAVGSHQAEAVDRDDAAGAAPAAGLEALVQRLHDDHRAISCVA